MSLYLFETVFNFSCCGPTALAGLLLVDVKDFGSQVSIAGILNFINCVLYAASAVIHGIKYKRLKADLMPDEPTEAVVTIEI